MNLEQLEKNLQVINPKSGLTPLYFNRNQCYLFEFIQKENFTLVLKSRQQGISTLLSILAIAEAHDNRKNILFFTKNPELVKDLIKINPRFNRQTERYTRDQIEFKGGGKIDFRTRVKNNACGRKEDYIIVDESIDFTTLDDLRICYGPTVWPNGKIIVQHTFFEDTGYGSTPYIIRHPVPQVIRDLEFQVCDLCW